MGFKRLRAGVLLPGKSVNLRLAAEDRLPGLPCVWPSLGVTHFINVR